MTNLIALPLGKREVTKAANRLAILEAARAVFGELGYEAATVRDIIRRTGLASGTFYNYYRSKEELFEALSDDAARRLRPILRHQYETAPDFQSYIYGAVRAYFSFMAQEHETWQAKRPVDERQPIMNAETPEMTFIFHEIRDSIRAVIDRGDVRPAIGPYRRDPEQLGALQHLLGLLPARGGQRRVEGGVAEAAFEVVEKHQAVARQGQGRDGVLHAGLLGVIRGWIVGGRVRPVSALPGSVTTAAEQIAQRAERACALAPRRVVSVAGRLGVAPSSVTEMVKKLAAAGLITHVPYGPLSLTAEGRRRGAPRRQQRPSGCRVGEGRL